MRAGEVLRLTAVFQDTRRAPVANGVSGTVGGIPEGKCSRSSERDQYAQCLDSHGHELFAPLSARGEFYATCQSGSLDTGSDAVLYRVHQLARRDLPLRVRSRRDALRLMSCRGTLVLISPLAIAVSCRALAMFVTLMADIILYNDEITRKPSA